MSQWRWRTGLRTGGSKRPSVFQSWAARQLHLEGSLMPKAIRERCRGCNGLHDIKNVGREKQELSSVVVPLHCTGDLSYAGALELQCPIAKLTVQLSTNGPEGVVQLMVDKNVEVEVEVMLMDDSRARKDAGAFSLGSRFHWRHHASSFKLQNFS